MVVKANNNNNLTYTNLLTDTCKNSIAIFLGLLIFQPVFYFITLEISRVVNIPIVSDLISKLYMVFLSGDNKILQVPFYSFWASPMLLVFAGLLLICLLVFCVSKIIDGFINKKYNLLKNKSFWFNYPELYLFGFILIWGAIALPFASNTKIAFFGYPYDKGGYIHYIAYGIVFLSALVITKKQKNILIDCLLGVAVFYILWTILIDVCGVLNVGFDTYEYSAVYRNRNFYGYFLALTTILAVGRFYQTKKIFLWIYYMVVFALNIYVLLLNKSRGGFLGIVFSIVFFICATSISRRKFDLKLLVPVIVAVLTFVICEQCNLTNFSGRIRLLNSDIDVIVNPENYSQEQQDAVGASRLLLWKDAISIMKQSPLFGNGIDCYFTYSKFNQKFDMPHNEFLQLGSNIGILPMIAYFVALVIVYVRAVVNNTKLSDIQIIALSAMSGYIISSLFGNAFSHMIPYYVMLIAFTYDSEFLHKQNKILRE